MLAPESRFDLAYNAIMHAGQATLRIRGYRPATAAGHHATAIQTLPLTVGYDQKRTHALDAARRKRNGLDYEGDSVSESMADSCTAAAQELVDLISSVQLSQS